MTAVLFSLIQSKYYMIKEDKMRNSNDSTAEFRVNRVNNKELEINTIWISLNGLIRN